MPLELSDLENLKDVLNTLSPEKRQKVLRLAGLIEKPKRTRREREKHSDIDFPNKIVTTIICCHCGWEQVVTRHPRKKAVKVVAGSPKRDSEKFTMQDTDIVIEKHTSTRFCRSCPSYVQMLSRENLEKKYLELLMQ